MPTTITETITISRSTVVGIVIAAAPSSYDITSVVVMVVVEIVVTTAQSSYAAAFAIPSTSTGSPVIPAPSVVMLVLRC